jgi:hypothetical protein
MAADGPMLGMIAVAAIGFFKNPPGSVADAVKQGEGANRGFSEVRALMVIVVASLSGALLIAALVHCTPAQGQQVKNVDSQAIALTDAVCSLAPDAPPNIAPEVEIVCALATGGEQLVSIIANTLDPGDGGAVMAMQVPMRSIRFRMKAADAPKFLADHMGKR